MPLVQHFWNASCRLAQALMYSKVRAAIGVQKAVISGGGSLAPHLDTFYEAIGLPVLNGWGLSVRLLHRLSSRKL